MRSLQQKAIFAIIQFLVVLGFCIFIPAYSFAYWQGWGFIALFGISISLITAYLMKHDVGLLQRRMSVGPAHEGEPLQRLIQTLASFAFVALFVISALDYRFTGPVSPLFTLFGYALVALGLYGVFLTFKANSYAAGTVGVEKEQKLVTSGLYAWVRHPMYASAFFLLIGVPLSLGSVWGEVPAVVLMVLIVWRLLEEEKTLRKDLKGYTEYAAKVRARLIPGIF